MSDVRTDRLRVAQVGFLDADTQRLVEQVQAEYVVLYGGPDTSPIEDGVFDPPRGAFFLGYLGDEPVAMGGWRLRPDVHVLGATGAAEIKRMYVAPAARGAGHARTMLAHLESTAALSGAEVMILETGLAQPEAIALYESSGYTPVPGFGYYKDAPLSRCFGKLLTP